ncbi:tryptophan synthase subunit alpha [Pleionea sp. CnH1-48]|uniref:tryptophan synthase subunit alpha n=1 Tax=Pleionea sp. CnH1-48 TaxID=2954494 RepID=UPI002097D932|nr:tryptophan synthase subunit alpha [Pleionea sp. CnH1-48]MCO7223097.1 tryptophan synthase subunit alpha [Pleionea sp. CnH1-48]
MSRYQSMFERCEQQQRIAFIPFVMIGDPDLEASFRIISALIDAGADALELGIPFSDPVADGPVIQNSAIRALESGTTPTRAMALLEKVRAAYPDVAIGLLLYANLVYVKGLDSFYQQCQSIGIDSVLIADVPLRETTRFDQAAAKHQVESVHILPPHASEDTLMKVAKQSKGYTYVLGRAGVTGTDKAAQMPPKEVIEQLHSYQAAPPVLGFGVSRPEHVAAAKEVGFRGAISGSATVAVIESNLQDTAKMLDELGDFVAAMKQAT